ncbi:MAG: HD domain-containing protein [Muribaculaceae bacterium]|nr:HD domain-containing protein [Muribaculaceae bacterium]
MLVKPDINWLFKKYYSDNHELRRIILIHSQQVAKKALAIAKEKHLKLNDNDIYVAAMLHDIGVVKCNAPDIYARGTLPYLQHGCEGKKILDEIGLYKYGRICLTHTGSGITKEEIIKRNLPLPPQDMLPKTLLEKLICYADKFYSKSRDLKKEKNLDQIMEQMAGFGEESLNRFLELHNLFNTSEGK